MAFDQMRIEWRLLSDGRPGERFEARYERHRGASLIARLVGVVLGGGLVVAGILMLVFPGPGILGILLGLGLLGGESRFIARLLDRLERWATRTKHERWDTLRRPVRVTLALVVTAWCGALALVMGAYTFGLDRYLPWA